MKLPSARTASVGRGVMVASGLGLVAAGALPWLRLGPGSTRSGFAGANFLFAMRDVFPEAPPPWIVMGWYVVPFAGCVLAAVALSTQRPLFLVTATSAAGIVALAYAGLLVTHGHPLLLGPRFAGASAALAATVSWTIAARHRGSVRRGKAHRPGKESVDVLQPMRCAAR